MKVYLVQHGEAKSESEDPERSLTEKGRLDVEKVSAFIQSMGLTVSCIWHSGKTRAAQTAQLLAPGLSSVKGLSQREDLAPNSSIEAVKRDILEANEDIAIVGHLPFLSKLATSFLIGKESPELIAFRQAGIVCLERSQDSAWRIAWILVPEMLP
jgi:phosphohistidine phosphatase